MGLIFHPPREVIELALEELKANKQVHPDAVFNATAPDGLRKEVTYRDLDFTYRLGRTSLEEKVVDAALQFLKSQGLVTSEAGYDGAAFESLRRVVKQEFKGSWTSLSPTMERLIYMLTSVRRPKHLVEFGSFWGYTLAWFAGPCIGMNRCYEAEKIYGIDINAEMTERARENFGKVPNSDAVKLIAEDAGVALDRIPGPLDFVYIEAKSEKEKGLYLTLLQQVYDKLPEGAWVTAHDNLDYTFREEIQGYLSFVRDKAHFSCSICFDIDDCGIELSIK